MLGIEIVTSIAAAAIALLGGGAGEFLFDAFRRLSGKKKAERPYSVRLSEEMTALAEASRKVDALLDELRAVAATREASVRRLEADLVSMQQREQELRRTIEELENVPLPVAERFAALTHSGERRSAIRDYVLFAAGVVVSTIVGIILELIF